ncbi:type III effector protein [Streptomyces sp. NPDC012769]|uniref:type III effector protein n=1 Tax=Streptomyces sp. NPDC012769 TaxID=3364848 RepID=UPI00369FF690
MAGPEHPAAGPGDPVAVHAALTALAAIDETVRKARTATPAPSPTPGDPSARTSSEEALAALLLLRELREQLAGWEPGLIEAARDAGASWADLAHPLGVTSRQAAERRYLRVRPGKAGTTAEQRVQATRDRRAADRSVTAWAHGNAADLRRLAGQITALDSLPLPLREDLDQALADNNPAQLLDPLSRTHAHLAARHPELAERVGTLTRRTTDLRNESDQRRSTAPPL